MTEDYVSVQTAELLKEKGMDKSCFKHYVQKNNNDGTSEAVTVCTLQMAMKWLREVHNIFIDISPTHDMKEKTIHFIWQIFDSNYDVVGDCEIFYDKYEIACEATIKYCLENLI